MNEIEDDLKYEATIELRSASSPINSPPPEKKLKGVTICKPVESTKQSDLMDHYRVATDESANRIYRVDNGDFEEYACNHCPKKFRHKCLLEVHESRHPKQFTCQFCNITFSQHITLQRHMELFRHPVTEEVLSSTRDPSFFD